MALTKRQYIDGETIITAQNLNDIQDEVIAHETNKVPTSRTVNSKALSSNITLNASDVGAVPTTRKINSKALSSDITLSPNDVGAVPRTREVNNKALTEDITLTAEDVGAAPTNHASTATTYGKGTSSNYGHVKISDSLTNTTTAATGGLVPSMKAVNDLHTALITLQNAQEYHVGDTFTIRGGLVLMAVASSNGTEGGAVINLPKEIGSDVTSLTWTGTINFWGEKDHPTGITGLTITGIIKTSSCNLALNFSFPSGNTVTARTMGFLNMNALTITFN